MAEARDSFANVWDTIDTLRSFWLRHPELRLGQIVASAAGRRDPFYVEDATLIEGLKRLEAGLAP